MVDFPEKSMIAVTAAVIALALGGSAVSDPSESVASGLHRAPAKVAVAEPHHHFAAVLAEEVSAYGYESASGRKPEQTVRIQPMRPSRSDR